MLGCRGDPYDRPIFPTMYEGEYKILPYLLFRKGQGNAALDPGITDQDNARLGINTGLELHLFEL